MLADGLKPIGRGHRCLFVHRAIFVRRTIAAEPLGNSLPLADLTGHPTSGPLAHRDIWLQRKTRSLSVNLGHGSRDG